MSITAKDLIEASMRSIGVLASGESADASDVNDGLTVLNQLLDSWSTQNLTVPNKVREVFSLVNGTAAYTMGTGGTWNTSRPMKIENALLMLAANSPVIELPMDIITKDQYANVVIKTLSSNYPQYLYPDNAYPLTTVTLYPVPNTSVNTIAIYSWKPLTRLAANTTTITFPPGYERALKYALALELAPDYGREPSQAVVEHAMEAKANIKRMNFEAKFLKCDPATLGKPAVWNWYTGGTQ